ncbi:MAG: hypothetical protein IMZ44_17600 [Planctomycetes bacterium]|nr:hypothetical protein [Planctomycetota bacterium]
MRKMQNTPLCVAALVVAIALVSGSQLVAAPPPAPPPDLTQTSAVDRTLTYNLGATGLRGWIHTKPANFFESVQGRTTTAKGAIPYGEHMPWPYQDNNGKSGCAGAALRAEEIARHPNIILCMTDDQGWGDVRYNGLKQIRTPALDAIVGEALKFIEKNAKQDKPFFACVWFGNPHAPHKPVPEDLKAAGGSAYYGEIVGIDRAMGTVDHQSGILSPVTFRLSMLVAGMVCSLFPSTAHFKRSPADRLGAAAVP